MIKLCATDECEEDYLSLDKDNLVLFVVNFLEEENIEPTFDKVVVTVFKLFPKKFCLIDFPEYPDGKLINICAFLRRMKIKGWLWGNAKSGYRVTEKGKCFLDETKKILEGSEQNRSLGVIHEW
jgi:hypothetical protein